MAPALDRVFVYGTLKRGECREKYWPRKPLEIVPAWVRGTLYDTGPYPALVAGDDRVLGELWIFASEDIAAVHAILDEVEDYREGRDYNLYDRRMIECTLGDGSTCLAQTYLYARLEELPTFARILPATEFAGRRMASWPGPGSS